MQSTLVALAPEPVHSAARVSGIPTMLVIAGIALVLALGAWYLARRHKKRQDEEGPGPRHR